MLKETFFQKLFIACVFLLPLTASAVAAQSTIHTINSMIDVEKYVDKQTLVLFDLDHTVFEGKEYGYGHANWFYDEIENAKAKGINEKAAIFNIFPHWVLSQKTAHVKPVESLTPDLIKKFQKNEIFVMGLTSRQVPLAHITVKQLKEIDVDFTSNGLPEDMINTFYAPTLMLGGVVFCSEYNDKGEVLQAYLNKHNIHPKKIVIIDDSMRNLHSVDKAYANQAQVVGLYYPLVGELKKKKWNEKLARKSYCDVASKNPQLQDFKLDCQGS